MVGREPRAADRRVTDPHTSVRPDRFGYRRCHEPIGTATDRTTNAAPDRRGHGRRRDRLAVPAQPSVCPPGAELRPVPIGLAAATVAACARSSGGCSRGANRGSPTRTWRRASGVGSATSDRSSTWLATSSATPRPDGRRPAATKAAHRADPPAQTRRRETTVPCRADRWADRRRVSPVEPTDRRPSHRRRRFSGHRRRLG